MLEYFRAVEASGEPLVVTDRGREVLVIRPIVRPSQALNDGIVFQESLTTSSHETTSRSQDEILEELRVLATPLSPISEDELIAPLPLSDWEVERESDYNL